MTILKGSEHDVLQFGLLGFQTTPLPLYAWYTKAHTN